MWPDRAKLSPVHSHYPLLDVLFRTALFPPSSSFSSHPLPSAASTGLKFTKDLFGGLFSLHYIPVLAAHCAL